MNDAVVLISGKRCERTTGQAYDLNVELTRYNSVRTNRVITHLSEYAGDRYEDWLAAGRAGLLIRPVAQGTDPRQPATDPSFQECVHPQGLRSPSNLQFVGGQPQLTRQVELVTDRWFTEVRAQQFSLAT